MGILLWVHSALSESAVLEVHPNLHMAYERVLDRVLRRLTANDAIALASQKEKVINLLHKELLAERVLVEEEGIGSTEKQGVAASPQYFSASVRPVLLAGI